MSITEATKIDVEKFHYLRGALANGFAQVEFMLGDLIDRCRIFNEYDAFTQTISHSATTRIRKVRRMLVVAGPLTLFAEPLTALLDRFVQTHDTRNLLTHGFAEYRPAKAGEGNVKFRKWHRTPEEADTLICRTFTISELATEKEQFGELTRDAYELFRSIHEQFGWTGSRDEP